MDWLFYSKKIITALVLPPTGPLLVTVLGLLLRRRWLRTGVALTWTGVVILFLLSLPWVSTALLQACVEEITFNAGRARTAQAIVILGGGRKHAPEYGGQTISELALERVRYGAMLARELQLPILVTGGAVYGKGIPEGTLMARVLEQSFATSPKWIESRSRDTHENALFSDQILEKEGLETIVLVTQDFHMRRGTAEFKAVGMRVIPAPVSYARVERQRSFPEHLPSAHALRNSAFAIHELLGDLVNRIAG
jgi:uncharacterized SAM-binding protein YcdF (DUF218 family)